jgi:thiol-disulfide isomerase/thioredoxin
VLIVEGNVPVEKAQNVENFNKLVF